MSDYENILKSVLESKPLFTNENELVHHFALALSKAYPDAQVRFEVGHRIKHLRYYPTDPRPEVIEDCYIDLMYKLNGYWHAVEFKYHTSRLKVDANKFEFLTELKEQAGTDALRFGFRKDVYRLEQLKIEGTIASGVCILLTNNPNIHKGEIFKNMISKPYVFKDDLFAHDPGWDHSRSTRTPEQDQVYWKRYSTHNYILPLSKDYKIERMQYIPEGVPQTERNSTFEYFIINI